jgi:beta-N-acetylhexosaminidase
MLAAEGLPAVMSGHLAFPKTAAASAPASLSSWFLQDVLREKIGYRGLVITDDLMMNGATTWAGSLSRAAKQALLAGNDIIMLSKTPSLFDPVWTVLLNSMKEDAAFRRRVRDAARRTLEVKLRYLRGEQKVPYVPDLRRVEKELPDPEGGAFFLNLAARSVTLVQPAGAGKKNAAVFPLTPENAGRVLLAGQFGDFFNAGTAAFPGAASFWYSETQGASAMAAYARNADTIIFCLADAAGLRILQSLERLGKRVIVLSVLSPVYLESVPWVDGALAVYSYSGASFAAGFSAIIGRIPAAGRLPYE